jgi:hypothetical protein
MIYVSDRDCDPCYGHLTMYLPHLIAPVALSPRPLWLAVSQYSLELGYSPRYNWVLVAFVGY